MRLNPNFPLWVNADQILYKISKECLGAFVTLDKYDPTRVSFSFIDLKRVTEIVPDVFHTTFNQIAVEFDKWCMQTFNMEEAFNSYLFCQPLCREVLDRFCFEVNNRIVKWNRENHPTIQEKFLEVFEVPKSSLFYDVNFEISDSDIEIKDEDVRE